MEGVAIAKGYGDVVRNLLDKYNTEFCELRSIQREIISICQFDIFYIAGTVENMLKQNAAGELRGPINESNYAIKLLLRACLCTITTNPSHGHADAALEISPIRKKRKRVNEIHNITIDAVLRCALTICKIT